MEVFHFTLALIMQNHIIKFTILSYIIFLNVEVIFYIINIIFILFNSVVMKYNNDMSIFI